MDSKDKILRDFRIRERLNERFESMVDHVWEAYKTDFGRTDTKGFYINDFSFNERSEMLQVTVVDSRGDYSNIEIDIPFSYVFASPEERQAQGWADKERQAIEAEQRKETARLAAIARYEAELRRLRGE